MEKKERFGTEWEKELRADEISTKYEEGGDIKVVLLAGLQRCGQLAGLKRSYCKHTFVETNKGGIFQCVYEGEFDDGSVWTGSGDCSHNNTDGKFINYPTAIAESRAEARMLRKALGIRSLSSEEIGFREGIPQMEASPDEQVDDQVIKAIEKLVETKKITLIEVFEAVIDKNRIDDVFSLEDLNTDEASKVMEWLNGYKAPKVKKKSKKEERELRKKELKESLNESKS